MDSIGYYDLQSCTDIYPPSHLSQIAHPSRSSLCAIVGAVFRQACIRNKFGQFLSEKQQSNETMNSRTQELHGHCLGQRRKNMISVQAGC